MAFNTKVTTLISEDIFFWFVLRTLIMKVIVEETFIFTMYNP